ncbi:MAG TPA: hypothetical protein VL947_06740 [Cytophagales bacterium]|nr:hypothetical protein [Cytophagales bacterium]
MDDERIVIVCYKPLEGKEEVLEALIRAHVDILREEGLASDRPSIVMRAKDGTFLEVFAWKSKEAIEAAHFNPRVQKLWEEFAEICEYVPVAETEEAGHLFSEFSPI